MGISTTEVALRAVDGYPTTATGADGLDTLLNLLVRPHLGELASRLDTIEGLNGHECETVLHAAAQMLRAVLVTRLPSLPGCEPDTLHADTLRHTLHERYPALLPRVDGLVGQRCAAVLMFARHWAADRPLLVPLFEGRQPGALWQLSFAADESRRGGHSMALVHGDGGRMLYKPRPMAIDAALAGFLAQMRPVHSEPLTVRLPASMGFAEHGWSAHITPRAPEDDEEGRGFHRGLGQWLALARLFGSNDLRPDNLVAHGGHCYTIDSETLFAPRRTWATDDFAATLALATRHLDRAMLARFLPELIDAFDAMAETLHILDGAGALRPMMGGFDPCRVRVFTRATEVYAELERILWHPLSLRDERVARERAHAHLESLTAQAVNSPRVIAAEIDELLEGNLPLFETTPEHGRLDGPGGTRWGKVGNLVDEALLHWRHADVAADRDIVRRALETIVHGGSSLA